MLIMEVNMRTLKIKRTKKIRAIAVPFWIVTDMSKEEFKLATDLTSYSFLPRITGPLLDTYGTPIKAGQEIEIKLRDDQKTVFAVGIYGTMSDEIILNEGKSEYYLEMDIKGGWIKPVFPVLKLLGWK
jgi:hypothetical protein